MITANFYFSVEEESVCVRKNTILMQAFCSTCSDFHMEKTVNLAR